ncbi:hypothetical protein ACFLU6_09300 [Acidobacteriota bacterium]
MERIVKFMMTICIVGVFIVFPITSHADKGIEAIDAPVVEARLFKNGLAMVTRAFVLESGENTYRIKDTPRPVHGTLWFEGDSEVRVKFIEDVFVEKPHALDRQILLENLAGKDVQILLDDKRVLRGTVLTVTEKPEKTFDSRYEQDRYRYYYGSLQHYGASPSVHINYIVLSNKDGIELLDFGRVTHLKIEGDNGDLGTRVTRPVMQVTAKPAKRKAEVRFSYLTRGLSWAPSYRLDLADKGQGTLALKAVVKNELMDMAGAQLHLISGYPSVRFEHVISPVDLAATWTSFFQQLSQDPRSYRSGSMVMSQQAMVNMPAPGPSSTYGPMPDFLSDGYDIHFQDAGVVELDRGEALMLPIDKAALSFERIVNWIIPDIRNERGRYRSAREINQDPEKFQDAVWDAVEFRNPFRFPMTTGPIAIYKNGHFHSQAISFWTAPEELSVINVAKALNIRVKHSEHEIEGKRERIYIMGDDYQESQVQGQLVLRNYRKATEHVVITRRFSGQLVEAEGDPKKELLSEGVYSVNERSELRWEIDLAPGQEMTFTYRYRVLVDI